MAPVALQSLTKELRAFIDSGAMLQKDVAAALQMSPSGLADVLSGRNRLTGTQVISTQNFLHERDFKEQFPNGSLNLKSGEVRNLADAKEVIAALRQELAQAGQGGGTTTDDQPSPAIPAPIAATVQKVAVAPNPPPQPAHVPIVARRVAPTVAAAPVSSPFALLSLDDVIAGYKNACGAGNRVLANAYEAEVAKRTTKPRPVAPKSLLPDNPKALQEFLDSKSTAELKSLLHESDISSDQGALYKELKARGQ
jgi:hypothetical protein